MRKLLLLLLFSVLFPTLAFAQMKDDANCQGAWLFTEGEGTTVADSSQNSNTGTFKGAGQPAWAGIGPTAYAAESADFDGVDDYISFTATAHTIISYVGWVYSDAAGESVAPRIINSPGYLWFNGRTTGQNDDNLRFQCLRATTTGDWYSDANTLPFGAWQHIAITYDGTSTDNDPIFYIDGVSVTVNQIANPSGAQTSNAGTAYMGNNASSSRTLDGRLTELADFDDIITLTEINDIMDNGLAGAAGGANVLPIDITRGFARGMNRGMR